MIEQPELPPLLKDMLENDRDFVNKIRLYNNSLCLATWGVEGKVEDTWSTFKLQGRVHHMIGTLQPEEGQERRWAQWYIHDGSADEEAQGRIDNMPEDARCRLDKETVKKLQAMLHEVNSLVKVYKQICEIEEEHSTELKFVLTEDGRPMGTHERTYNLPVSDEIALVKLDESLNPGDVQIYLRPKKGEEAGPPAVQRINHMNRKADCLHYTLLFPFGQDSWHKELRKTNGRRLTSAEFYRHLFQIFTGSFNGLLR